MNEREGWEEATADRDSAAGLDVLERFHLALVASIETSKPEYLWEPFSVGEIYLELAPYRTHRDLIGVTMNGDYEHALMRLLSGDGDYLILESPNARDALRKELGTRNPDTGLYKEYAQATVRLNPATADPGGEGQRRARRRDATSARDEPGIRSREAVGPSRGADTAGSRVRRSEDLRRRPVVEWGWQKGEGGSTPGEGSSSEFWAPRAREGAGERVGSGAAEGDEPPSSTREIGPRGDRLQRLMEENERLKILLAERVLEIQELRARLASALGGAPDDL